jgi:hypothetical protein
MIIVESKRKKLQGLQKKYPNAEIIDLTSSAESVFSKFSPFYPHGDIPIPFCVNRFGKSVEGIWQGLKVFENQDIDTSKFFVDNMKNIKRSVRVNGKVRGHRKGVDGSELLDYGEARKKIYLKCYAWILDHKLQELIQTLMAKALRNDLVLLDYETNTDVNNLQKPLSHAGLVKLYIEKKYPAVLKPVVLPSKLF